MKFVYTFTHYIKSNSRFIFSLLKNIKYLFERQNDAEEILYPLVPCSNWYNSCDSATV